MKIRVWTPDGTYFVLLAAIVLAGACDANHVLGVADAGQPSGSAGTTGAAGATSPVGTAGVNGAAGSVSTTTGTGGAAGTTGTTTGTGGAAEVKADPTTLGPAESWTGYVENHMFHSGSDAIVLTFAADAKGIVKGTIVFGMGTPPLPATDPNVGYPPELLSVGYNSVLGRGWTSYVAEGYPYAFDGGVLDMNRLRVTFNPAQLWAGWCGLETPASDGSGRCVPDWAGTFSADSMGTLICALTNPNTMATVPVDCSKYMLCGVGPLDDGLCSCAQSGCVLTTTGASGSTFDVFLTGDTASGSANLPSFGTANVHFVKN